MTIRRGLIVGGVVINVSRVPFVVRLYTDALTTGFCGGSLIGEQTVLTAAHCIDPSQSGYVGTYHNDVYATSDTDLGSDLIRVTNVYIHPLYDPNDITLGHDVAVLTLQRTPLRYGENNGPTSISLGNASFWPRLSSEQPTDAAYVLGYGANTYEGPQSMYLRCAHVNLYSHDECVSFLGFNLSYSNLCAGLPGSDSCSGDSGGPLIVAYNGTFVQVGVVSWGVGYADCGEAPGVYSLTSSDYDFLAPFGARYIEYSMSSSVENACACADDCISNGFSVFPRCGCADHLNEGETFCYVHHDDCAIATHSSLFLGALYRTCGEPPVPPSSPPFPQNFSVSPSPVPPLSFPSPPPHPPSFVDWSPPHTPGAQPSFKISPVLLTIIISIFVCVGVLVCYICYICISDNKQ